jgi:dihydroxyacetone kinase-like protein
MCNTLTNELLQNIFFDFAATMQSNASYLTRLDEAIGDGDHGWNMALGFQKIQEQFQLMPASTPDLLLRTAGMTLVTTVSGASGPLYGAAFIAAGMEARSNSEFSLKNLARMVQAAEGALVRRGRCRLGDKTIFDALHPATQALAEAAAKNISLLSGLEAAAIAARQGMEATIPLIARRGLAMQYGSASTGHQDPGATSCYLLFDSLYRTMREYCS